MKCKACGAPVRAGSLSCDFCGSSTKNTKEIDDESARFDPIKSVIGTLSPDYGYKSDPNSIKPDASKPKNSKTPKFLILSAIVILLMIIVL
jgi:hypothetical protein